MNPVTQTIILSASTLRMLPHIAIYLLHRKDIDADLTQVQDRRAGVLNFIKACTRERTFRNLFYYRIGEYLSAPIRWMLPGERTLNIWCPSIGKGAHLEHAYATYLNAEGIGERFYCLQMQQRDDRCRSGGVHRCAGQLHGSGKPGKDHPQTAGLNSNRQQSVEISTQFTSNVILPYRQSCNMAFLQITVKYS